MPDITTSLTTAVFTTLLNGLFLWFIDQRQKKGLAVHQRGQNEQLTTFTRSQNEVIEKFKSALHRDMIKHEVFPNERWTMIKQIQERIISFDRAMQDSGVAIRKANATRAELKTNLKDSCNDLDKLLIHAGVFFSEEFCQALQPVLQSNLSILHAVSNYHQAYYTPGGIESTGPQIRSSSIRCAGQYPRLQRFFTTGDPEPIAH